MRPPMPHLVARVALGVALFVVPGSWGQVAEHPVLLALSKTDHTLSIVDPATLKVIAKMPVGPDPHEVIASADGTRAWVSNMLDSHGHELDVLDLVNHKALPSIDTSPMDGLHGLDFQGGKVWFTAQGAKAIGRLGSVNGEDGVDHGDRARLYASDTGDAGRSNHLRFERAFRQRQHHRKS